MSSIGSRLVLLREKRGLKQSEAARLIGISKANLSRYESNKRNPSREALMKLANFYKVSASYLLFEDFEYKQNHLLFLNDITPEEAELLERYLIKIREKAND